MSASRRAVVAMLAAREYLDLLKAYGLEPFYNATYVVIAIVFAIAVLAGIPRVGLMPRSALLFFLPVFVIGSFVVFALAMRRPSLRSAFPSAGASLLGVASVAFPLPLIVGMPLRAKLSGAARRFGLILLLFVWGYLYTGLMSLSETYLDRLRAPSSTPTETQPAPAGASAPGF